MSSFPAIAHRPHTDLGILPVLSDVRLPLPSLTLVRATRQSILLRFTAIFPGSAETGLPVHQYRSLRLQPNASRIVSTRWCLNGFLAAAEPVADRNFDLFNADSRLQREVRLDPTGRFDADRIVYHRQDLHAGLCAAAEASENENKQNNGDDNGGGGGGASGRLPGPPVEVRITAPIVAVDTPPACQRSRRVNALGGPGGGRGRDA